MLRSTQIGTIRGIPIRIHFTLFLAFLLFVMQFGLIGIPTGLALFASVLAHELGHSVVARRLGVGIAAIDLHLLGGAALMEDAPETPGDEVLIAAAGPAVSFAIGFAALGGALLTGAALNFTAPVMVDLFAYVAAINIGMGVFNLVPALPMDGGRIFRALMARKLGQLRATEIAAKVARVFAVLFVGVGILSMSLSLGLIGIFIYALAGREEQLVRSQEMLRRAQQERWARGPANFRWQQQLQPATVRVPVIDVSSWPPR